MKSLIPYMIALAGCTSSVNEQSDMNYDNNTTAITANCIADETARYGKALYKRMPAGCLDRETSRSDCVQIFNGFNLDYKLSKKIDRCIVQGDI